MTAKPHARRFHPAQLQILTGSVWDFWANSNRAR